MAGQGKGLQRQKALTNGRLADTSNLKRLREQALLLLDMCRRDTMADHHPISGGVPTVSEAIL